MWGEQIVPCFDLWDPDAVRECGCCHGKHAHCEDKSDDLAPTKPMSRDKVLSSNSTMVCETSEMSAIFNFFGKSLFRGLQNSLSECDGWVGAHKFVARKFLYGEKTLLSFVHFLTRK